VFDVTFLYSEVDQNLKGETQR